MMCHRLMLLLWLSITLAGCITTADQPLTPFHNKGESDLNAGIKNYEKGYYHDALTELQSAISAGLNKNAEIRAHKYSAFIYCVTGKKEFCRDEFKKVLGLDPAFTLDAAEAGHPMWGPVFRSVKSGKY